MYRITAADMQARLLRMVGGQSDDESIHDIRSAIRVALRLLSSEHIWPTYADFMYLETSEPYTTGTIAYTASTRTVVLSSGTWPSWMSQGSLIIDTFHARVDSVASSTTLTVTSDDAPVDDYSGTYTAYRYQYSLPVNYNIYRVGKVLVEQANFLDYLPPDLFETQVRRQYLVEAGRPRIFTLGRDFRNTGAKLLSLWPYPDSVLRLKLPYIRHPRDIRVWEDSVGQVATTASSDDIVGTNTAFASKHVGCVIRTYSDRVSVPTDTDGRFPYVDEAVVKTVTDATNIITESNLENTQSDVAYSISDILDVDNAVMNEAVYYRARLELAKIRSMAPDVMQAHQINNAQALYLAKCQSSQSNSVMVAGSFGNTTRGWPGLLDSWYVLS